jgi:hypothetical protein
VAIFYNFFFYCLRFLKIFSHIILIDHVDESPWTSLAERASLL